MEHRKKKEHGTSGAPLPPLARLLDPFSSRKSRLLARSVHQLRLCLLVRGGATLPGLVGFTRDSLREWEHAQPVCRNVAGPDRPHASERFIKRVEKGWNLRLVGKAQAMGPRSSLIHTPAFLSQPRPIPDWLISSLSPSWHLFPRIGGNPLPPLSPFLLLCPLLPLISWGRDCAPQPQLLH